MQRDPSDRRPAGIDAAAPPRIQIVPVGNLGNQMLQLMLAEALQQRWPALEFGGVDLPDWQLRRTLGRPLAQPALRVIGQYVDLALLRTLTERRLVRELEFAALGFRMANYLPRTASAALFPRRLGELPPALGERLLINVRGAEILADTHVDYGPIPIAFYRQLVAETGLAPIFMGQIGSDAYSAALRAAFPGASMLPSRGAMGDFELIRAARHVVVSVSTFSWLAAWLSNAETVHLPVYGMFNPAQRDDIDLLPLDDARYRFYRFAVRRWSGATEQFDALLAPAEFPRMSLSELQALRVDAEARLAPRLRGYRRRLVGRALLRRVFGVGGRVGLDT